MIRFLLAVSFISMAAGQQEPCEKYVSITDERRSARYRASLEEPNICDKNIDESAWYRFQVLPPSRIHDKCVGGLRCGTDRPVWLRGNHPTASDSGPKVVEVCSRVGDDCCGWRSTITVKFCLAAKAGDEDYYVYRLKRLPQCDMAYCAGDMEVCKTGTVYNPNSQSCTDPCPSITPPIFEGPIIEKKTLQGGDKFDDFYFACSVQWTNPDTQKKGEQFEVVFTFDGKEETSVAPKITDGSNLRVRLWSKEIKGHAGKTVGCKIRSHWKLLDRLRSDYQFAQGTYYVGIRYSITGAKGSFTSPRIEINENSPPLTLYFEPTVPISCPETTLQTSCKVTVTMADISTKDKLGVRECSVVFSGLDSDVKQPTQMIKAQTTPGTMNRVSVLRFEPVDTDVEFFWNKFQLPDIPITIKDTSTSGSCNSIGDPHITTFDKRYYHVYTEGDYIFSKSTKRHFEVHVRHHKCFTPPATCNCAVAVREGNNVLGVNACKESSYTATPITYLRDRNVPGATITSNGNRFTLTMPSGAYIIADFIPYGVSSRLDIHLYLNSEDYGLTSGLCGVWNGRPGDDTVVRGTATSDDRSHPVAFSNSYRLRNDESFINGHAIPINCLTITDLVPNICKCDKLKAVTCAAPDTQTTAFDTKFTEHCNRQVVPNRRDLDSSDETTEEEIRQKDMVITVDDIPLPVFDEKHGVDVTVSWPTRSGITAAQATKHCRSKMNGSPVYKMCKGRIGKNSDTIIASCVADVQLTDDLTASAEAVACQFQTLCVYQLEISVVSDGSSVQSPVEVLLAKVVSMICPGQCNGNGDCRNGTCVCNDGFAGDDCSVNTRNPPQLSSFRKNPICDLRKSFCVGTSIFATNIFQSERLSCRVSVQGDDSVQFTLRGSLVSTREVMCPLPVMHTFINEIAGEIEGPAPKMRVAPFYKLDIALTNDGELYSNSLQLTVYDSKCQECRADGTCVQKADTCIIEGRCYQSGEVSRIKPCNKCIPSKSRTNWTHG